MATDFHLVGCRGGGGYGAAAAPRGTVGEIAAKQGLRQVRPGVFVQAVGPNKGKPATRAQLGRAGRAFNKAAGGARKKK